MNEPLQIDGSLIYRLDKPAGHNVSEVNVSMWAGSREANYRSDGALRVFLCLIACRDTSNENLEDDYINKTREDRDALLNKLAEVEHQRDSLLSQIETTEHQRDVCLTSLTDLYNAGKGMLDRFDRSAITEDQPTRQCRRMQQAIDAAKFQTRFKK